MTQINKKLIERTIHHLYDLEKDARILKNIHSNEGNIEEYDLYRNIQEKCKNAMKALQELL